MALRTLRTRRFVGAMVAAAIVGLALAGALLSRRTHAALQFPEMILPDSVAGWRTVDQREGAYKDQWRSGWRSYANSEGRKIEVLWASGNPRHVVYCDPFGICEPQEFDAEKFTTQINSQRVEVWRGTYRTSTPRERGYAVHGFQLDGRWLAADWLTVKLANSKNAINYWVLLRDVENQEEAQAIATEFTTALLSNVQIMR